MDVITVPTSNSFAVLDNVSCIPAPNSPRSTTGNASPKPPTHFVYHEKTSEIVSIISKYAKSKYRTKFGTDYISIMATTVDDHRSIVAALKENQVSFFTYSPRQDKPVKVLLRGVVTDFEIDEIRVTLQSLSLPFVSVNFLTKVIQGHSSLRLPNPRSTLKEIYAAFHNQKQLYQALRQLNISIDYLTLLPGHAARLVSNLPCFFTYYI